MNIGWIGTGLMGVPMAHRLLQGNFPLVVYNRTPAKLEPLRQAGAVVAESVAGLLPQCQAVILMLTDATAIRELLFTDTVRPLLPQHTVIQMGTIAPSESRCLQEDFIADGADYFEAPVLGSIPEAQAGQLQIMVGSTPEQFQQWLPVLQVMGAPQLIGPVGTAAALKLALNQLIASLTTAFASSLSFVQQYGVPVDCFMEILRHSALYAPTFDKKLQCMLEGNYANPNFPTKHLLKDTNLFLKEAVAAGLQVDSLEGVRQILEKACALGLADADYSALRAAVQPSTAS